MMPIGTPFRSIRRRASAPSSIAPPRAERLERRRLLAGVAAIEDVVPNGPEFRVNTNTVYDQKNPASAMDADGDFVIVWQSDNQDQPPGGGNYGIFGQRYNANGAPVGPEFLINTTTDLNQTYPAVAMTPAGNFVVAWQSADGLNNLDGIFAQRFSAAGVKQGPEFLVNTHLPGMQARASVAIDADADFVVAWQSGGQDDPPASAYGVYAQRFNAAGVKQGGEFRANAYTDNHQAYPSVAMDHTGNFLIAWHSHDQDPGGTEGVYAQRYTAGGVGQGEFRVNSAVDGTQWFASAAMDADGDFVIAWHSDGTQTGIQARRFNAAGVAQGGEFRANTTTRSHDQPAVAMDADGDFVIVWQKEETFPPSGPSAIFGQRFNNAGAAVGGQFQANMNSTNAKLLPTVAMDADGDFVVAWNTYGQDSSAVVRTAGVYARHYKAPQAGGVPRVTGVYVRGETWSAPFMTYLQAQGLGSSTYGFALGGATQLADLPWRNVDQISIVFDGDVSATLDIRGVNVPTYDYELFYDPDIRTATSTFTQPLGADKILIEIIGDVPDGLGLDGEWTAGGTFPSGDGVAGGDFRFRFDVLPGNVNRTGNVLADDFSAVKARFFRSTTAPGTGANTYTIFHDVDGSGTILADDFSAVKARFFSSLPGPEPTGGIVTAGASSVRSGRPPRTDLFSSSDILE